MWIFVSKCRVERKQNTKTMFCSYSNSGKWNKKIFIVVLQVNSSYVHLGVFTSTPMKRVVDTTGEQLEQSPITIQDTRYVHWMKTFKITCTFSASYM